MKPFVPTCILHDILHLYAMIFEDSTRKRWRFMIAAFWMFAVLSTAGIAVLALSATVTPALPENHPMHDHVADRSVFGTKKADAAFLGAQPQGTHVSQAKSTTEIYRIRETASLVPEEQFVFEQVGNDIPEHTLLLTFDDGPEPEWTPQILDIMDEYGVKGVFFVTGKQALRYPDLLKIISDRGHIVGNHTYSHPNIFDISSVRLRTEINMTERAIEDAIGKRTMLFRSPYFIQTKVSDTSKFPALEQVSSMGYAIVGANIDSRDWEVESPEEIIKNIESEMRNPNNHIILLHDAGGDRSVTIAALRQFIPRAQANGFRFVSVEEAIGIPHFSLMPPVTATESVLARLSTLITRMGDLIWALIKWLFFLTTIIATLRVAVIGTLVVYSLFRKEQWRTTRKSSEPVTVIIPAYNEEQTIVRTVQTVLQSTYPHISVVVVDDGSIDATSDRVRENFQSDPRVTLVQKDNGGKFTALNRGFIEAETDIIITIDADTLVESHCIEALIRPFVDPEITAACGNVQVGNSRNLVTGFQSLEYITTQNFDRRAFDTLNCISVVPGATSAWRRLAVLHAGGFTGETLAEDADLTLTLLREGAKIVYVPEARSMTEAPLKVSGLARQRFRWVYGTMQCLQKHTGAFFHGTLGWFALPNILLFHILFPLLAPIGDIALLVSLFQQDMTDIVVWYFLFIYIDLFGSLLAFTLERKPRKAMWLILIQRFCYRQFMYVILFKSITAALRGDQCSWNRVERTGTVLSPA